MGIVIDTCIISRIFSKKGPPAKLLDWMQEANDPAVSVVTIFEIEMGLKCADLSKALNLIPEAIETFGISVLEFSLPLAQIASDQSSMLKKTGRVVSMQNLWIGATAKGHGYDIATANVKDFDHWEGVEIINPQ